MAYLGARVRRNTQRKTAQSLNNERRPWSDWWQSIDWGRVRFQSVALMFMMLWGALWVRAGYLQLYDGEFLAEKARRQYTKIEVVAGKRGSIMDRNGTIMARSVECRSIYINPRAVKDQEHVITALSSILNLPAEQLAPKFATGRSFEWIARKVNDANAETIAQLGLPGVGLVKEEERLYPLKQVAGQLLGFTNVDGAGLEGLERALDKDLSGLATRRVVMRDASGRRFYVSDEEAPKGQDVRLTLDTQVQFIAEEALEEAVRAQGAKWGGAMVVEVQSGEILAWAQYPFFNPNAYSQFSASVYRNRLALDAVEPGSTLKPLIAACAMQEGLVNKDTVFPTENGVWVTKMATIRDDGRVYKELPLRKIISLSSNIGMAKVSMALGSQKGHRYLSMLGFGQPAPLPVAQSKGILRKARDWSEIDLMATGFGQSLSVTTVQMAQAYLTIGNEGAYKPLRLMMDETTEASNTQQNVFSPRVSREVLAMMREVVEEGTGTRAQIPGMTVAGKTGTSQKANGKGVYGDERTASFVGFVPAEKPKYLVVIMIDEPQKTRYGGVIAAPVFKNVLSRTLAYHGTAIQMDNSPNPLATVAAAEPKAAKNAARKKGAKGAAVQTVALAQPEKQEDQGEVRQNLQVEGSKKNTASARVPDVVGKSVRGAVETFIQQGIMPVVRGEGATVVRQAPEAGAEWGQDKDSKEYVLWVSER